MTLRPTGFFRELDRGHDDGPSLADASTDPLPVEVRAQVAAYLRAAAVLAATSAVAADALDATATAGPINVRTDGTFYWPEDLAYYVQTYGARPPEELIERALGGPPPELTTAELMACVREVRGW